MIQENIDKVLKFFNLNNAETLDVNFKDMDTIPKHRSGVYIISQDNTVIYVGKGKSIRDRNDTHREKAYLDETKKDKTYVPEGWKYLRENYNRLNLNPDFWLIQYVTLNYETERTAVEGALIFFLNPIANDEVYSDNKLKGNLHGQ